MAGSLHALSPSLLATTVVGGTALFVLLFRRLWTSNCEQTGRESVVSSGGPALSLAATPAVVAAAKPEPLVPLRHVVRGPVEQIWAKSLLDANIHTDLPRLVSRLTLLDVDGRVQFDGPTSNASGARAQTLITDLLEKLFAHFGEGSTAINKRLQEFALEDMANDATTATASLIRDLSSLNSSLRTLELCKLVHQKVIMGPASTLKRDVALRTKCFLKDVREVEGWLVDVRLGPSAVSISHTRIERSAQNDGTPEFDVRWSMTTTVNTEGPQIADVSVELLSIDFAKSCSSEERKAFEDLLNEMFS